MILTGNFFFINFEHLKRRFSPELATAAAWTSKSWSSSLRTKTRSTRIWDVLPCQFSLGKLVTQLRCLSPEWISLIPKRTTNCGSLTASLSNAEQSKRYFRPRRKLWTSETESGSTRTRWESHWWKRQRPFLHDRSEWTRNQTFAAPLRPVRLEFSQNQSPP